MEAFMCADSGHVWRCMCIRVYVCVSVCVCVTETLFAWPWESVCMVRESVYVSFKEFVCTTEFSCVQAVHECMGESVCVCVCAYLRVNVLSESVSV